MRGRSWVWGCLAGCMYIVVRFIPPRKVIRRSCSFYRQSRQRAADIISPSHHRHKTSGVSRGQKVLIARRNGRSEDPAPADKENKLARASFTCRWTRRHQHNDAMKRIRTWGHHIPVISGKRSFRCSAIRREIKNLEDLPSRLHPQFKRMHIYNDQMTPY
jgi:hypothetical protein